MEAATRAVTLSRSIGSVDKEVEGLMDLAVARLGLGEIEAAADLLGRARKLAVDVMSPADMSLVLALSAEAADRLGESKLMRRMGGIGNAAGGPERRADA